MSRVTIRKAEPRDVTGIVRVCSDGWRDTYRGLKTPEQIEAVIAEFYTPERIRRELEPSEGWDGWIVAVDDDGVVGAGGGGMTGNGIGELFVLYLDPARRGEGIGTLILGSITEQQRAKGAREQWVSVEPDNAKGLPFYAARGSQVRGERPEFGSVRGEGASSLRLARPIGGASLREELANRAADPHLARDLDELSGQTLDEL